HPEGDGSIGARSFLDQSFYQFRPNALAPETLVHEQLAEEERVVFDEALQPTDIRAIECDDPNLRHVPALAKAGGVCSHVELQLFDDIVHCFEIEMRAIMEVFCVRWSEDDPRCPDAVHLLVNYFIRSEASTFIARSRRLIIGKRIDAYACDAKAG